MALVAYVPVSIYGATALSADVDPTGLLLAAVALLVAGAVLRGGTTGLVLAAGFSALALLGSAPLVVEGLANPAGVVEFAYWALLAITLTVSVVGSSVALVRRRRVRRR